MNNYPPSQYPPASTMNGHRLHHRQSADFRQPASNGAMANANGNGPVPVPSGPPARMGNGHPQHMRGMAGFDGPRSPPNGGKNTAHVPCKFFRQGACQAGKACPFMHSTEPSTDVAPCKYFQKGNCKFGAKCALAHILPNGQRVNRPNHVGVGGGQHNRANPMHQIEPAPAGSSMLSALVNMVSPPPYPYQPPEDLYNPAQAAQKTKYDMIPTIDTTFSSHPGSTYGSPPNDGRPIMSPQLKGLSILDAPLPASFDSQGISHMARYGPIAASMPGRFGLDTSPPSSYPTKPHDSSALRTLHTSAFGDARNGTNGIALGSSPPAAADEPVGRRIMHSERFSSKPKLMSASLGARPPLSADDWDDENFAFEEDLVPTSLHELLTPQEKMRRFSRTAADDELRQSLSGLGSTPVDAAPPTSKFGSPPLNPTTYSSSPSRFSALFSRQKSDSADAPGVSPSPFGHVGSPLRNSSLHPGASPSLRALSRPPSGDVSPFVSSPPRQASMSMISQQLQRTRLTSRAEAAETLHPGLPSRGGASSSSATSGAGPRMTIDRAVSSSSNVGRERIEEEEVGEAEQEQGLFSMDGLEPPTGVGGKKEKRFSGGIWGWGAKGSRSPSLGPIGGGRREGGFSGL
ncbi:hypothetical protein W97_03126 [Coniosporium apollinis CBS 100218]|uniref:C3H1-type domain-containing protein n=1 Tax=Coniosporium apollinis (strain CBS 100218) TaxID=1168221 RepID=R7YPX1_CONA1|nr:uncharacterized protein W97_03126 [Coniosporium apollinis CBS 100218]EON63898.1 hypothetical protein W97_03126 [Coniosporium apollinis CBS 100218]